MMIFREITTAEQIARYAAQMIQQHSWGLDYPVNAWDELKDSDFIIGCFDNENLVGLGSITRGASPDKIDNELPWLANALVLPEYRRQGLYKELYNRRIEYLRVQGEEIILTCTDNPLVERFLFNHGWQLRRVTKDESGGECKVFQFDPRT